MAEFYARLPRSTIDGEEFTKFGEVAFVSRGKPAATVIVCQLRFDIELLCLLCRGTIVTLHINPSLPFVLFCLYNRMQTKAWN